MSLWLVELSRQRLSGGIENFTYTSVEGETKEIAEEIALAKAKDEFGGFNIWIRKSKLMVK